MAGPGKYIYGIVYSEEELNRGPCAIPGGESAYTISYRDISALVSDSETVDYLRTPKDVLGKLLLRHQRIVENVMGQAKAIVPVKLGTIAEDENEVIAILRGGYALTKDILRAIRDKVEIDVIASWNDFGSVLKEVAQEKHIQEYKESLLANLAGVTLDDQMKVGLMVKKALDKKREKCVFEIQRVLVRISDAFRMHEPIDDAVLVNAAFLVPKGRLAEFDREVTQLDTEFEGRLNFKCVGPLPPYSFYTIEVSKINYSEIDWARKKLGLHEVATKEEIRKAHRKSAFRTHPDTQHDISGMEEEFDELTRAHKLLLDYCMAEEQLGKEDVYSFKEEEFADGAFLVRLKD